MGGDGFSGLASGSAAAANPFLSLMDASNGPGEIAFQAPLPLSSALNQGDSPSAYAGVFHFAWPSLNVVALEGSATTTSLLHREWISLLFLVAGELRLHQSDTELKCSAGDCLFIPQSPATWSSSSYSVVCLLFSPQQLSDASRLMQSASHDGCSHGTRDFSKPTCRKSSDGDFEACLLITLRHLLQVTSELAAKQPTLLTHLGLAEQLALLAVLLASPAVQSPMDGEIQVAKNGGVEDIIDDVRDYMLSHLSDQLNLSSLETYSHYSRRSLQYAFRKKYGVTITQWIRAQRLEMAYHKLRNGSKGDTVNSIARACGYRSTSLFSLEFQNRFHIKPSVFLRQHMRS